jgi:uncharacterized protein
MSIEFEWDEAKNLANQRKHGIDFEQASRVFYDPLHVCRFDRIEDGEVRFNTMGLVAGLQIVVVVHTDRYANDTEVIRVISARLATKPEKRIYENENG